MSGGGGEDAPLEVEPTLQAYDEALSQDVMEALRDFGLPADALELEITENIALNREDSAVLQRLHGVEQPRREHDRIGQLIEPTREREHARPRTLNDHGGTRNARTERQSRERLRC